MAGEGGQRLFNALFVANIGQNMFKNDNLTVVASRNLQTALCHGGQKPQCFDANRLTAGIGAGNNDGVHSASDGKGHRHGSVPIEQRMPCFQNLGASLFQQFGANAAHLIAQLASSKNKVQLAQQFIILPNRTRVLGGICREFCQNPFNFGLFLAGQNSNVIVQFHNGGRLHKQGCTAGAGVVHHAGKCTAVFRLHRNNKTSVTLGNDIVLQCLGVAGSDFSQHIPYFCRSSTDLPPNLIQLRTGMIGDLFFRYNGVFNFILKELITGQQRKIAVQRALLLVTPFFTIGFGQSCRTQQRTNGKQFYGIEKAALFGTFQCIGNIFYAGKGRTSLQTDHAGSIFGLFLQFFALRKNHFRPKLSTKLLCRRGRCFCCQ